MNQKNMTEKIYGGLEIVTQIAAANFLILLGIVLGMGIFGIGPSIQSGHHLAKKIVKKETAKLSRTFFTEYKKVFISSNKLYLPIVLLFLLSGYETNYLTANQQMTGVLLFLLSFVQVALLGMLMILFPLREYYEVPVSSSLQTSIKYLISNPVQSLLAFLWLGICYYGSWLLPGIIPFFTVGLWVFGNMGLYINFFNSNEEKIKKRQTEALGVERKMVN